MAKQFNRGGNNIFIPELPTNPLDPPSYLGGDPTPLDANYNIFEDPNLASRGGEFLASYLGDLGDDEEIFSKLNYGEYGDYISDDQYRAAMLSDISLYGTSDELDIGLGNIEYYTRPGGASDQFQFKSLEIDGKKYSREDLIDLGIDVPEYMNQNVSYRDKMAEDIISQIKSSENILFDKTSKSLIKPDKDLKESYFTKAAKDVGLKNIVSQLDPDKQKELVGDTENYGKYIDKIAGEGAGMMQSEYNDVLSGLDNMYTNVIDNPEGYRIPDEDETGEGGLIA